MCLMCHHLTAIAINRGKFDDSFSSITFSECRGKINMVEFGYLSSNEVG